MPPDSQSLTALILTTDTEQLFPFMNKNIFLMNLANWMCVTIVEYYRKMWAITEYKSMYLWLKKNRYITNSGIELHSAKEKNTIFG